MTTRSELVSIKLTKDNWFSILRELEQDADCYGEFSPLREALENLNQELKGKF